MILRCDQLDANAASPELEVVDDQGRVRPLGSDSCMCGSADRHVEQNIGQLVILADAPFQEGDGGGHGGTVEDEVLDAMKETNKTRVGLVMSKQ